MFSSLPKRHRVLIRLSLSITWAVIALGGFSSAFLSPRTITAELGSVVLTVSGIVVLVAGMTAALGVALDRYRIEWVAAWLAGGGIAPYAVTVWWLVYSESGSRFTQAFYVTALLLFATVRAQFCAAHAARLRTLTQTGAVPEP